MVTQIMMRTHEGKIDLKKTRFVIAFNLIKCLNQIKKQILLLKCAPNFELPSNYKYHDFYSWLFRSIRLIYKEGLGYLTTPTKA